MAAATAVAGEAVLADILIDMRPTAVMEEKEAQQRTMKKNHIPEVVVGLHRLATL